MEGTSEDNQKEISPSNKSNPLTFIYQSQGVITGDPGQI